MPASTNAHEAKTDASQLLDRVHGGEEIIFTKSGKSHAWLDPIAEQTLVSPRTPGGLTTTGEMPDAAWFDPLPSSELDGWNCGHSNV
jgi:antitoxin (DNA-binding transcriptional repressor) of toxin-antitoxin stability system